MSMRCIWLHLLLYTSTAIGMQSGNEASLKSLITPIAYEEFYAEIEMYRLENDMRKSVTLANDTGSRIKSGNVQRPLSSVPIEMIHNLLTLVKTEYSPELHNMAHALQQLEANRIDLCTIINNTAKNAKSQINQILANISVFLETYQRNIALFNGLITQWTFGNDSQIAYIENKATENVDFKLIATNKVPLKEYQSPKEQSYSYENLNLIEVFLAQLDETRQLAEKETLIAIDSFKNNRDKFHMQKESLDIIKQNAYDFYRNEIAYRNASAQCFLPFSTNSLRFLQYSIESSSQITHDNHVYTCALESNKYQSLQKSILIMTDHITKQIPSDRSLLPQETMALDSLLNNFITLCKSHHKNDSNKRIVIRKWVLQLIINSSIYSLGNK